MDVFAALAGHAMGGRGDLRPVPQLGRMVASTPIIWSARAMPVGSRMRLRVPAHRAPRRAPRTAPAPDRTTHIERWP
ncbi:MAG: hypothetical protein JWM94_1841 [Sphingomonas bacterium]|nr:hypothetical protein [Sphingomonas bacterium]